MLVVVHRYGRLLLRDDYRTLRSIDSISKKECSCFEATDRVPYASDSVQRNTFEIHLHGHNIALRGACTIIRTERGEARSMLEVNFRARRLKRA